MFYVAATRARKMLYLSYPREVMSFDRQTQVGGMSPFLAELSPVLLDSGGRPASPATSMGPVSRFSGGVVRNTGVVKDPKLLQEGTAVRHPFFGEGRVEKMAGNRSVEVFFPRHGRKTLHLDYAKLEVVG